MDSVLCRLCAEPIRTDQCLHLDLNAQKCSEVVSKLSFLNATYVDVSKHFNMPRTVCLVCYDSLNKAYEFLYKVRQAQDFFSQQPASNPSSDDAPKTSLSEEDCPTFEEILASQSTISHPQSFKLETHADSDPNIFNTDVTVKQEDIKYADGENLQYNLNNFQNEDSLNVQEILDAALNTPFNPNDSDIEIYAKEVPLTPKTEDKLHKTKLRTSKSKIKTSKRPKTKPKLSNSEGKQAETEDRTSWSQYPWVCGYCKIEFPGVEMLRAHARLTHGKCGAFSCADCKYYGQKDDFNSFVKHVRKHREEFKNVCQYCDSTLPPKLLSPHISRHFALPALPCLSCGEVLADEEAFRLHVETYIAQPRKKRRKPNTPITQEELTCKICNNLYKTLNSLRDHITNQHKADRRKEFTCDRCGKMFFSKGTLTTHVMRHDSMKPHVCIICTKSFLFPNQLRRHVESHSGVKPYACEQCPKRFRLRRQLASHAIVHTDAMPYACQYCTKAFRFKQILVNHERQHTGAKAYECAHCGMQFSCWSNYNKHMKRRHNTTTARKRITPAGTFPIDPRTGQMVQPVITGLEEWKSQIMLPVKRGKKPIIKQETVNDKNPADFGDGDRS